MACKLVAVSGMAFEAKIAAAPGIRSVYGLNPAKLESDIENAIKDGASALLSFGTAAGLAPDMQPGSLVVARRVLHENQAWSADAEWSKRLCAELPQAHYADIAGVDHPLATTKQKAALGAKAAVADMESHRVVRIAAKHQLPFAAIRVVLDDVNRTLPPAALVSVRANGTVDYFRLVRSLLTNPGQLPALMQLAGDSKLANKALVDSGKLFRSRLFAVDVR
jgi:hopanoid-associated phosphorylase